MKKQITRISVLQSSKVVTALYVVIGFFYTIPGILMVIFGANEFKIMGMIYCAMPVLMAIFWIHLFRDFRRTL